MKHLILSSLAFGLLFCACQSNKKTETQPKLTNDSANKKIELVSTEDSHVAAEDVKEVSLMKKGDCYACHTNDAKLIGPSFKEIAQRYPAKNKNIETLVDKIINGGSGVWGQVPMQAHSTMSKSDATEIVNYILSLK
jgi:cytochrome c